MKNLLINLAKKIRLKIENLVNFLKQKDWKSYFGRVKFDKGMLNTRKRKIVAISAASILVLFFVALIFHHREKVEKIEKKKQEQLILSQTSNLHSELSNISIKIADVQKKLQSGDEKDIQSIEKTLTTLSDQVKTIADSSNTIIEKAIELNTHKLQQQLGNIQTQLTEIKDHKDKVSIVSPDQLGFEVVDIFNMDHENIVSIHYGAHTVPLVEGENIAGWKLAHVSFNDQKAEFVNDKNQHVIVNLNTPKS